MCVRRRLNGYRSIWCGVFLLLAFCSTVAQAQSSPTDNLRKRIEKATLEARGKVGVALTVLETGESVSLKGDQPFPMQSVYKMLIAIAVLHFIDNGKWKLEQKERVEISDFISDRQHSPIRDQHPQGVEMSIKELLRFMVSESDGTACDVLLRVAGGPNVVTRFLRGQGLKDVVVATTEKEMGRDKFAQYRNWATPNGMTQALRAVQEGRGLSASSRALLLRFMTESPTGPRRIRGRLPAGTPVAHKTGSSGTDKGLTRATNDVGIVTLPNRRHLAIVVFVSDSTADETTREEVIAKVAKAAWDRWSGQPHKPKKGAVFSAPPGLFR